MTGGLVHHLGGSGTPVLIVHATGFAGPVYAPLAAHLRSADVYAIDLPGHGQNPVPDGEWSSWTDLADAVEEVARSLPRPHVLCHSIGAAVSMKVQRDHALFASVFAFEPALTPDRPVHLSDNKPSIDGARRRRDRFASRAEALARYRTQEPLSDLAPECLEAYVQHCFEDLYDGTVTLRCRREQEAHLYVQTGTMTFPMFDGMPGPLTVAVGGSSASSLLAFTPELIELLPGTKLVSFDGLAHLGPLEAPAVVAAAFEEHLQWADHRHTV